MIYLASPVEESLHGLQQVISSPRERLVALVARIAATFIGDSALPPLSEGRVVAAMVARDRAIVAEAERREAQR